MKYLIVEREKQRWFQYKVWALDAIIVISVLGYVWLGINIVRMWLPEHGTIVYNCSIAEIHPDYTTAMRRACREQFKKETK
jgi:hypothetical protein